MKQVSVYDKMTRSEREVAELLKEMGIRWSYEHPVFVRDDNNRPRVWTPDFYLINFGIYVEVCGSKDFDYRYRREIFDKNGHKVIFLHLYKHKNMWKNHLEHYMIFLMSCQYKKLNEIFNL